MIVAHVAGIPLEEAVLPFAGSAGVALALARAWLARLGAERAPDGATVDPRERGAVPHDADLTIGQVGSLVGVGERLGRAQRAVGSRTRAWITLEGEAVCSQAKTALPPDVMPTSAGESWEASWPAIETY